MTMFRNFVSGVCRHGRQAFDGLVKSQRTSAPVLKRAEQLIFQVNRSSAGRLTAFSKYLGNYAVQNLAADLRRQAALRFQGGSFSIIGSGRIGTKLPIYAFLGISLATGYQKKGYISDDVCDHIKDLFKPSSEEREPYVEYALGKSVADYDFGGLIAKGCNAAVYSAALKDTTDSEDDEAEYSTDSKSFDVISEEEDGDVEFIDESGNYIIYEESDSEMEIDDDNDSFEVIVDRDSFTDEIVGELDSKNHDQTRSTLADDTYAVKVMFLYSPECTLYQIQNVMETELLPASLALDSELMNIWENGHHSKKKQLPPHPNIVEMMGCFVDDMPCFPDALVEYPVALPERINPDGLGCNKTLFLVMKRYPCTLRQYLAKEAPSIRHCTMLFAQLIEAVVHLCRNDIAHRDLKSDNILLDDDGVDTSESCRLVLTDFGSCLLGLRQWYPCAAVNRGGNAVLMAPEISSAMPGFLQYLDYEKSDLWAAGAIAYEIFGGPNPFYIDGANLDSRNYLDSSLPHLPEHVPDYIETIVKLALRKDPSRRPSADMLADMLHLVLWCPASWLYNLTFGYAPLTSRDIKQWLVTLSAEVICCSLGGCVSVDQQLKRQFLARLHFDRLLKSVDALWAAT